MLSRNFCENKCMCDTLWSLPNFCITWKLFREINYILKSLLKKLFSRNFFQKVVVQNFRKIHNVYHWKDKNFAHFIRKKFVKPEKASNLNEKRQISFSRKFLMADHHETNLYPGSERYILFSRYVCICKRNRGMGQFFGAVCGISTICHSNIKTAIKFLQWTTIMRYRLCLGTL